MTVDELLGRIDSSELTEWLAYAGMEPFGPPHEDLRAGYIASLIYGSSHKRSDAPKQLNPSDFFPSLKPHRDDEVEMDPELVRAYLEGITVAMGGEVK